MSFLVISEPQPDQWRRPWNMSLWFHSRPVWRSRILLFGVVEHTEVMWVSSGVSACGSGSSRSQQEWCFQVVGSSDKWPEETAFDAGPRMKFEDHSWGNTSIGQSQNRLPGSGAEMPETEKQELPRLVLVGRLELDGLRECLNSMLGEGRDSPARVDPVEALRQVGALIQSVQNLLRSADEGQALFTERPSVPERNNTIPE